ncbi:pentapeptide repeat-containing protein [Phormidesmis priestleyi]
MLLGLYVARQAQKGDEKFALIRALGLAIAAIGGTSFCGANLTGATFTGATLKSTNFNHTRQQQTIFTHVCWENAKQLDKARVGDSILANAAVRELLVTRNGYKKSYIAANLEGANLNGANLNEATLTRANLSSATLHRANLTAANLREVSAINTDFSHAHLTAACLQAWNIDHTTQFDHVDCQYVFLLEKPNTLGSRERRPHEPDQVFATGDFEKLYKKMMNVVQVLLRNGMKNQMAFNEAFQQLLDQQPALSRDSLQSVERKGDDALVTLEVPQTADKADIARSLRESYQDTVIRLEAENEQLKLRVADLKEVALQKAQIFNQFTPGGQAMQEANDSSRNINVGGNLNATGSTFNLGEISGSVTNTINQLPDTAETDRPNLKQLLTQLKEAIESDTQLPETGKVTALEQVKTLAEVGQNPDQPEKKNLGTQAIAFFKTATSLLPDTAKLAEACSKLLPLISKALGLG